LRIADHKPARLTRSDRRSIINPRRQTAKQEAQPESE
jgi:hypothetical protein